MSLRTRSPQHAHAARAGAQLTFAASHLAALHFLLTTPECHTAPLLTEHGRLGAIIKVLRPPRTGSPSAPVRRCALLLCRRLVPCSALCHFPDRHLPPTGDIRMSKTSAPDALSMSRCATCSDHALNSRPARPFARSPERKVLCGREAPLCLYVQSCSLPVLLWMCIDTLCYAYAIQKAELSQVAHCLMLLLVGLVVLSQLTAQCCSCSGKTSENPSRWQCCSGWQSYNVLCYATLLLCPSRAGQHAS